MEQQITRTRRTWLDPPVATPVQDVVMEQQITRTRRTWRVNVREIANALGLGVSPSQWVVIEDAEDDGDSMPLAGWVDVVVWESKDA